MHYFYLTGLWGGVCTLAISGIAGGPAVPALVGLLRVRPELSHAGHVTAAAAEAVSHIARAPRLVEAVGAAPLALDNLLAVIHRLGGQVCSQPILMHNKITIDN
eukprot:6021917-Pyramimonas_sp.AAC.1